MIQNKIALSYLPDEIYIKFRDKLGGVHNLRTFENSISHINIGGPFIVKHYPCQIRQCKPREIKLFGKR